MTDKRLPQYAFKHRMTKTPEYGSWLGMKRRCLNKCFKQYQDYGGRGIAIHNPWIDDFLAFFNYIGPKPEPKHLYSLDRIDNNGNYEPGNVRWATREQQFKNRRRQKPERMPAFVPANCKFCGKEFMKHPKKVRFYCSRWCNGQYNWPRWVKKSKGL